MTPSSGGDSTFIHKMSRCKNVTYSTINAADYSSYLLNNKRYTRSGTYTQTLPNAAGCDSIITLNLTLLNTVTNMTIDVCDSYTWNSQVLTSSGLYTHTFTAVTGCDSLMQLHLTIRNKVAIPMTLPFVKAITEVCRLYIQRHVCRRAAKFPGVR
jgi:hypothetical protein